MELRRLLVNYRSPDMMSHLEYLFSYQDQPSKFLKRPDHNSRTYFRSGQCWIEELGGGRKAINTAWELLGETSPTFEAWKTRQAVCLEENTDPANGSPTMSLYTGFLIKLCTIATPGRANAMIKAATRLDEMIKCGQNTLLQLQVFFASEDNSEEGQKRWDDFTPRSIRELQPRFLSVKYRQEEKNPVFQRQSQRQTPRSRTRNSTFPNVDIRVRPPLPMSNMRRSGTSKNAFPNVEFNVRERRKTRSIYIYHLLP